MNGIVLLGSGKGSRRLIIDHYHETCRRVRADVHIEVRVPVPRSERIRGERWRLEQRILTAQVFVSKNDTEVEDGREWSLEGFLEGCYDDMAESGFDAWGADDTAWQTEQPAPPDEEREEADDRFRDGCSPWDVFALPVFGYGVRPEDFEAADEFGGW